MIVDFSEKKKDFYDIIKTYLSMTYRVLLDPVGKRRLELVGQSEAQTGSCSSLSHSLQYKYSKG